MIPESSYIIFIYISALTGLRTLVAIFTSFLKFVRNFVLFCGKMRTLKIHHLFPHISTYANNGIFSPWLMSLHIIVIRITHVDSGIPIKSITILIFVFRKFSSYVHTITISSKFHSQNDLLYVWRFIRLDSWIYISYRH